jgi:hypothetical protein
VNMSNEQSRTADKGWSSGFMVGRELTTTHLKKLEMIKKLIWGLGLGRIILRQILFR